MNIMNVPNPVRHGIRWVAVSATNSIFLRLRCGLGWRMICDGG
jgi:hypothetical protein